MFCTVEAISPGPEMPCWV